MNAPIKGMKKRPWGEDFMADDFLSLVDFTLSNPKALRSFKKDTGFDLEQIGAAKGIDAMIDSATGRTAEALASFGDWCCKLWGEEEAS